MAVQAKQGTKPGNFHESCETTTAQIGDSCWWYHKKNLGYSYIKKIFATILRYQIYVQFLFEISFSNLIQLCTPKFLLFRILVTYYYTSNTHFSVVIVSMFLLYTRRLRELIYTQLAVCYDWYIILTNNANSSRIKISNCSDSRADPKERVCLKMFSAIIAFFWYFF